MTFVSSHVKYSSYDLFPHTWPGNLIRVVYWLKAQELLQVHDLCFVAAVADAGHLCLRILTYRAFCFGLCLWINIDNESAPIILTQDWAKWKWYITHESTLLSCQVQFIDWALMRWPSTWWLWAAQNTCYANFMHCKNVVTAIIRTSSYENRVLIGMKAHGQL